MKTMQGYTNYCTEEQTRRTLKLGAPIKILYATKDFDLKENHLAFLTVNSKDRNIYDVLEIPTTQQTISWLREKGIFVSMCSIRDENTFYALVFHDNGNNTTQRLSTYEKAELVAIDAALDYLENQKN